MQYNLQKGTKIIFPDTASNRARLCDGEDYTGFGLGVIYEIAGTDGYGDCYFFDGAGDKNYAGFEMDGSDGVFEVVGNQ